MNRHEGILLACGLAAVAASLAIAFYHGAVNGAGNLERTEGKVAKAARPGWAVADAEWPEEIRDFAEVLGFEAWPWPGDEVIAGVSDPTAEILAHSSMTGWTQTRDEFSAKLMPPGADHFDEHGVNNGRMAEWDRAGRDPTACAVVTWRDLQFMDANNNSMLRVHIGFMPTSYHSQSLLLAPALDPKPTVWTGRNPHDPPDLVTDTSSGIGDILLINPAWSASLSSTSHNAGLLSFTRFNVLVEISVRFADKSSGIPADAPHLPTLAALIDSFLTSQGTVTAAELENSLPVVSGSVTPATILDWEHPDEDASSDKTRAQFSVTVSNIVPGLDPLVTVAAPLNRLRIDDATLVLGWTTSGYLSSGSVLGTAPIYFLVTDRTSMRSSVRAITVEVAARQFN